MGDNRLRLYNRLKSCIQSILDAQAGMEQAGWKLFMYKELVFLRNALHWVGNYKLQEQDVCLIEKVTSQFLQELNFLYDHYGLSGLSWPADQWRQ